MSTENIKNSFKAKSSGESAKTSFTSVAIKKEPVTTLNGNPDPTMRLSSFSMPRDLTLGGAGRGVRGGAGNKKVFTPNLNVTRNKNATVKTSKDTSARGRNRPDRGKSDRGRGRGGGGRGGGGNLIQTSGVFSEGAGSVNLRKHISSGSYSRSSDDTPSSMVRPTLIKREGGMKIDIKAEEEEMRELLGDPDDDDFEDNKADPDWIPIKLNDAKWKELKFEKKEEPFDVDIKTEPTEDKADKADVTLQKTQQPLYVNPSHNLGNTPRYPVCIDDLLNSTQPQIFMMQLPDTLPCEDPDERPDNPPSTSKDQPQEPEPVEKKNPLKDMVEGQIGKLIRYKSGKLKLILGESHFDVTMGIETGFLQDVMSISTNREERSGNMINLGPIQAKLTATPDWEYLLRQK